MRALTPFFLYLRFHHPPTRWVKLLTDNGGEANIALNWDNSLKLNPLYLLENTLLLDLSLLWLIKITKSTCTHTQITTQLQLQARWQWDEIKPSVIIWWTINTDRENWNTWVWSNSSFLGEELRQGKNSSDWVIWDVGITNQTVHRYNFVN